MSGSSTRPGRRQPRSCTRLAGTVSASQCCNQGRESTRRPGVVVASLTVWRIDVDDAGQISDHRLVTARLVVHNPKPRVAVKWSQCLRDVNPARFKAALRRSELFVSPEDDANDFAAQLVRVVTDELDKVAPVRRGSRRLSKTITRWLSADAVAAKRERRRLERRWQRARNENDRLKYRRVCRTINKSREDYYQNRLLECDKLSAAKRWRTVNELLHAHQTDKTRSDVENRDRVYVNDCFVDLSSKKIPPV